MLDRNVAEHLLQRGDVGAVVHVYDHSATFEVELVAADGRTVALLTLSAGDIRGLAGEEILHVRSLLDQVPQPGHELRWRLDDDASRFVYLSSEVLHIEAEEPVGSALNCGGQDGRVLRFDDVAVWSGCALRQRLERGTGSGPRGPAHGRARAGFPMHPKGKLA